MGNCFNDVRFYSLNEKKWNTTLYKVMFKSHINVMTEDTFQQVQKIMEPLYDLFT